MARTEPTEIEDQLILRMKLFADDPEGYVRYKYPWGKKGTPLANKQIKAWQLRALRKIRQQILENRNLILQGKPPKMIKLARVSGRGVGKSAFLAWVAQWLFDCVPGGTVIVTANSEGQLRDKTFPEIRKWCAMAINSHWYDIGATSIKPQAWLAEIMSGADIDDGYWYIKASLWSKEDPDAFAGAHSQIGMVVLFDEASGIDNVIWPVTEGYFTDLTLYRIWIVISNGRRPTGKFFDCFHKDREEWDIEHIDARKVEDVDQSVYDSIIRINGADSDEARVEVYGQFPRTGDNQFIGRGLVDDARARVAEFEDMGAPLVMGVDPARFGDDKAVIRFRAGRDARNVPKPLRMPKCSAVELANEVISRIIEYDPDAVFIEGDGIGGGVIDIIRAARFHVFEVTSGGSADDKDKYMNHRVEMWARGREWLETALLPDDDNLADDLCGPEYKFSPKGALALETKDDMKKRGLASPNDADALMMTFSKPVARRDRRTSRRRNKIADGVGCDIFT